MKQSLSKINLILIAISFAIIIIGFALMAGAAFVLLKGRRKDA